jgi:VanZ family protein
MKAPSSKNDGFRMGFSGLDIRNGQLFRVLCALVLLGIMTAGLWPFHAARNDVSWLGGGNGVFLGEHGSMVSASPLEGKGRQDSDTCTIEIWLKPNRIDADGGGMILAFYSAAGKLTTFTLRQYRDGLVLGRESQTSLPEKSEIYVGEVFGGERPVLVTITSGGSSGTTMYADGVLKRTVPSFTFSDRDLAGQMVVGNSASTSYSWSGQLKGLAIYNHEFLPAEVTRGFADWTRGAEFGRDKGDSIVARYVFDEGGGRVVRNQVGAAANLLIPERFFVLNEQFLEPPWDEYRPGWRYWKHVLVNIVGLVPLGFVFYAYFCTIQEMKRADWLTIALGFATSLTIEVLQSFLPTRDSGMTDLFTNTLGTALGVILCAWCMKHNWFDIAANSSVADLEKQREDACLVS